MDNKFLTFIKPYLSFIDNGDIFRKPFSWLYVILAIINLILPLYFFFIALDNGIFSTSAKLIVVFLLIWIIIAFAGWVSFQLWWDRKSKVIEISAESDEFVATPVFSHLIQTIGEWLGTWIGIVGFGTALLTTIILGSSGSSGYYFPRQFGINLVGTGWLSVVLMPILGLLIIVATRFLAELFRAIISIANNTRKN